MSGTRFALAVRPSRRSEPPRIPALSLKTADCVAVIPRIRHSRESGKRLLAADSWQLERGDDDFVTRPVPSTGGVNASASGCLFPCQEVGYPVRSDLLDRRRLHAGRDRGRARARVIKVADYAGGTALPLPGRLVEAQRCVVHPQARGGGLARAPQLEQPRRDADRVVDVVVCERSRRPGGLVGARAGLSRVPDLGSRQRHDRRRSRVVAGMDDRGRVRSGLTEVARCA
jgi:hypothetical protein